MVFAAKGGIKMAPERALTSPAQRYYIPPEGGALNPPVRRQPITGRTLGAQGQRPGGAINPHARKGVSTYGNTGKHRPGPGPGPDPDRAIGALQQPSRQRRVKLKPLKNLRPSGPSTLKPQRACPILCHISSAYIIPSMWRIFWMKSSCSPW